MTPYDQLPDEAFWRPAVANKSMFDLNDIWDPKFNISPEHKVVTYGSCFSQHLGRHLSDRAFTWLITEPPPRGLSESNAHLFNYNVFSCRTGNIYTTSLLKQWVDWALGKVELPDEIWREGERCYDPFRPRIEPEGFISEEELILSRNQTITSFKAAINQADYFIFTMGLTETWANRKFGYEYPMCPGTAAGEFNKDEHVYSNQRTSQIIQALESAIDLMRQVNKKLKFILTVSPVPITATNSGNHVLVANMDSKSTLRAVAGQLSANRPYIDYFPGYELVNSPPFRGAFYGPNQRNVSSAGVNFVMDVFHHCLEKKYGPNEKSPDNKTSPADDTMDEICEEELLGAFEGKK